MLRIDEIYFLQYRMLLPVEWRCPLTDYYMNTADTESCRAFVLKENEQPVSYAIFVRESPGWLLEYIYTAKEKRRKGYASFLLREMTLKFNSYMRTHLIQSHPCYQEISAFLNRLGFVVNDTSCVYTVSVGENLWKRMDELKLPRMKEFLLRDGSACIPFCDMDDGIREQLVHSADSRFSNPLDPALWMQGRTGNVDQSGSMVLVKDSELLAYTLITRPSPGVVSVEQISEAQHQIGSGKIVAPLCASLEVIRRRPEIKKMNMAISDRNIRSYRFVMEILKGQEISVIKNTSFLTTPGRLKELPLPPNK